MNATPPTQPGVSQQELPPLPKPLDLVLTGEGGTEWRKAGRSYYHASDMEKYARAAIAQQSAQPVGDAHDEQVKATVWRSRYAERRALIAKWHGQAVALGYDGVEEMIAMALPCIVGTGGDERAAPSAPVVVQGEAVAWQWRSKRDDGIPGWQQCDPTSFITLGEMPGYEVRALYDRPAPAVEARTVDGLRDALNVCLGHLTGGLDGDWRDCDPAALARQALAASSPPAPGEGA